MTANGIKSYFLVLSGGKPGDRNRRLDSRVDRRLWDRGVSDMANLAMLFVGRMPVPMPGRLHGKYAHAKNQGQGQQS
jgi:hypothetical protein